MGRLADTFRKAVGAPLRALLPKNPWLRLLVFGIPVLVALAFLEPVLSLLGRGVDLVLRVLDPLLANPAGRLILVTMLCLGGAFLAWRMLRERWRALRAGLVLRAHMQAIDAMMQGQTRRARELFRRVARSTSAPAEYPAIQQDARIKLARLCLEHNDADQALAWLARAREKGLPKELQRSLVQLRAEAYLAQGEVLPQTLETELRAALERFGDDRRMLALLRRILRERGSLEEAADLQEKIYRAAPPRSLELDKQQLVEDLVAAGQAALEANSLERARVLMRRARTIDRDATLPALLAGRLHLAEGDARAAIREWGRTRSPKALELIAEVLDRDPTVMAPRELLESCPVEGMLLVVARELARAGEHRKALRAARRAARAAGPSPSVAVILAEVLALCGQEADAQRLCEDAALRLVAGEDAAS